MKLKTRKDYRKRRHMRVRKKIFGRAVRPRMSIMVSNKHIFVQFVDDEKGETLVSAGTNGSDLTHNIAGAGMLGRLAGESALKKDIKNVVVDRGGLKFHGCVKAVVDGVIEAGVMVGKKRKVVKEKK